MILKSLLAYVKKTLNHHGPNKQQYKRGNWMSFMNKTLSKATIHKTRFRNKYLKNITDESKRKQRNYCVSLLRKFKKEYSMSLDD